MRPGGSSGSICSLAARFVFREKGGFFTFGQPMIPTFRPDMLAHFGIQIYRPAIITPRTAEKNAVLCIFRCKPAFIKNKTARLIGRKPHRSGHVTVALAMDLAILEDSSGLPEDEIDMPLDITILVILSTVLGIERVLPREESAMFKNRS